MGKDVQFPGGTTEKENAVTGLIRQLRVDIERHSLRLHDGQKQGGYEIPSLEYIETLMSTGGGTSGTVNVIQMFNTIAELKNAQTGLNIYAILRESGQEDTFIWKAGAGDGGDIASDISGHWHRLAKEINMTIGLWRVGMLPLQIGGAEPATNQATTPWLTGDQLKLWDGTEYLNPTPALWMALFAALGGYYTGSASLPDRLAAQSFEIADLDTVDESGWYKSAAAATGAPVAGVHSFEHRELTSAIAIQIFHPHNNATRNYWVRYRTAVTPTWTSWVEVAGALPTRLAATSGAIADANTALESGMYSFNAGGSNMPTAAAAMVIVVRLSATVITQIAVTTAGEVYRRVMTGGVWGAWGSLSFVGHTHDDRYYTEGESDARYSQLGHNHDDRYYTEAEVNSLLSAKAPLNPAAYSVGEYAFVGYDTNITNAPTRAASLYGGTWQVRGDLVFIGSSPGYYGALVQRVA